MAKTYKGKGVYLKSGVGKPCCYCSRIMVKPECEVALDDPGRVVSVEHKQYPKSKGGGNNIENLDLACRRCNQLRGNLSLEIFEPFARIVVGKYRDYPYAVLLSALRKHIVTLAEIGARNKKEAKNAIFVALLEASEQMKGHDEFH